VSCLFDVTSNIENALLQVDVSIKCVLEFIY
jgi:hypothetical protein